ncbi:hypothetical protein [Corallococcus exercitus]|uniref:Uncharacterized protein n=1 Tax=Corallococcus exercitus TaxID=2316736 RepID=A0A7Y4JN13_9BACT|nr:hypothetical protein [Corallococcus exercitus]NOK08031.1 hypothetical protein [Corallococcus exercitus]
MIDRALLRPLSRHAPGAVLFLVCISACRTPQQALPHQEEQSAVVMGEVSDYDTWRPAAPCLDPQKEFEDVPSLDTFLAPEE